MFKFKKQTKARLDALEEDLCSLKKQLNPKILTSSKKDYGTQGSPVKIIKKKNAR